VSTVLLVPARPADVDLRVSGGPRVSGNELGHVDLALSFPGAAVVDDTDLKGRDLAFGEEDERLVEEGSKGQEAADLS
jgi:hypothetical protein